MGRARHAIPHSPGSLGRLRDVRIAQDLRQAELAEISGVPVITISRAENGRIVQSSTLYKLADALGVDRGELMTPLEDAYR
jgi:transcriptional regulator with XRE-family HTH domain